MTKRQEKLTRIIQARILTPEFGNKKIIETAYESVGGMCGYFSLDSFKEDLEVLNQTGAVRITRIDLVSALCDELQKACANSELRCGSNAIQLP